MKNSLKLTFLLLSTFSLFTWNAQAQSNAIHVTSVDNAHEHIPGRTCHAHTNLQDRIQASPMLEERMRGMEEKTQRYMQQHRGSYGRNGRSIPVYVHVIYSNSQENISDAQIQSQLDQLNADFAASNADYNPPSDFASVAAGNTGIQFTLEQVTRKSSSRTSWGTNDDMKKTSQGGVAAVTPSTHLNMWVCNIGGGILGYAQFPGTGLASTDGVVMSPQYFGSNNYGSGYYLSAPFDGGRTTTHEVGHYLNLRHIWGDGGCNVDDLVDDTPVAGSSNGGCPSATQNTCAGGQRDMHMNYMDYTNDDCMYMFSAGQKARMLTCLETTRASLGTATGGGGGNGGGGNTNCYATVGLDLVTDRYGSETTWTLKNAAGTTVESGSGYGNNTTTNLSWTLADGNYTFTINDSYGDGICCSYGNGSYTLVGDGSSFATNGAFGSSETVTFCVVGAAPACPNTNISLALTTDRYGSETSWSVTNAAGTTVESGNGYGNNNNYNILLNLPAGDYTFTINDSYGDGICCSYGNGSYTLNANGQQLTTGGNFGSSESFDFCAGGSNRVAARTTAEVAMTTEQVHLYPNPAGNTINVDLSETEETFTGRIVDATGRNVWVGELEAGANAVNISTLPAGLYYMAVVNADGAVTTKKFVKK